MTDYHDDDVDDPAAWPPPTDDELATASPMPGGEADVDRMLRRLGLIDARAEQVKATAGELIGRIVAWRDDRLEALTRQSAWLRQGVEGWALQHPSATVELPHGTIRRRPGRSSIDTTLDTEGLQLLGKEHPGWIRTKVELDKAAAAKGVTPGGEIEERSTPQHVAHAAVDAEGAVVEGVVILVPRKPSITVHPEA